MLETTVYKDKPDIDQVVQNIVPEDTRNMFKNLNNLQDFTEFMITQKIIDFFFPNQK